MSCRQHVLEAMTQYNANFPLNDYDNWLHNSRYHWAIRHNERLYPVKKIWGDATGQEPRVFHTHYAIRVLRELGFIASSKKSPSQAS